MTRSLGFPDVAHEQMAKPPLKAMLGQVQFPPILRIADLAALAPFQDALASTFPEFSPEQQISVAVGPEGAFQSGATQSFRFASSDRSWSVVLSPTALTLEAAASHYTSYDAFRDKFREVWEAALGHLGPSRRHQIGLRYIDHIEGSQTETDWSYWIRPEVLGLQAQPELGGRLRQSLSDLRFELDRGTFAFKHGLAQAGPDMAWGYLLDFDYFEQREDDDINTDTLLAQFDEFHDEIYAFFRWCVTENAVEEFRRGD